VGHELTHRNRRSIALGCEAFFCNDLVIGAWEQAAAIEHASWIPRRPSHELVVPSGSLDAALEIGMHWPSRTTAYLENGEVLDGSNPCMELLMSKGPSY
jgi:hypothetical protein